MIDSDKKAMAVLVHGGPAPGINGVISAATIEAINRGYRVLGVHDGFKHIANGDPSCVRELAIGDVMHIHNQGGSILGSSRIDPQKIPQGLSNIISVFRQFGVGHLITIGGDGTASNAMALAKEARNEIAVGHVPKTIDNDLPLPSRVSTFGYETARELGTNLVETLMNDARTMSRWYIVVTMGRKAGHLALGIGISSGASITIIPEEFGGKQVPKNLVSDLIVGSVIKRLSQGRPYGVAVVAEGIATTFVPSTFPELTNAERDPHGNIRYSDLDLGRILRGDVRSSLRELGIDLAVIHKNIGYELRSCSPNSFDREYTRQLGYGVVDFLASGGGSAMITRQGDALVPIPFSHFIEPITNRVKVRMVDVDSITYRVAHKYMVRLTDGDLSDELTLANLASVTNKSPHEFRERFKPATSTLATYPKDLDIL